ncbi:TetR-like C-terminal domain-containing protein [Rhizobium sp. 22-785-1]
MTYSIDERASIKRKIAEVCSSQIAEVGLANVSARSVAKGMRKTAGWLYTMYEDLDEIINAANSMTLKELNDAFSRDAADQDSIPAVEKLSAFANSFLVFARSHPERCAALFAPMPRTEAPHPALETGFRSLVSHIETPLAQIMTDVDNDTINATAKTVFTALHAIVSLNHRSRPAYSLDDAVDDQLHSFVNAIAAGYAGLRLSKLE